jgi:TolB protein
MSRRNTKAHRRRSLSLVVLAGVLTAMASSAPSQATPPGRNGEIAFARFRIKSDNPAWEEIWVVSPNGSGLRRVFKVRANSIDSNPTWAPDGSKLLFWHCAARNGRWCAGRQTLWSVDADGSRLRMLSPRCRRSGSSRAAFARCPDDGQGAYSPDGRSIAFVRYVGVPEIAIADSDLRHVRALLPFGPDAYAPDLGAPAWSPDGRRLAFSVQNDRGKHFEPVGGRAVFVININGSGLHRVTPWKVGAGPDVDWSPDGRHVLFDTQLSSGLSGDIYSVHPDGTGLQQLTHFPVGDSTQLGSYSPDGSQIVFATQFGATGVPGSAGAAKPDLFVMRADGSNMIQVTRTSNWEGTPQWGPAG